MSTSSRSVLRGVRSDRVEPHAFLDVSDLPRPSVVRPGRTGDSRLDLIHGAAWDEGMARGEAEGRERGYADGHREGVEAGRREGFESGLATARAEAERAAGERVSALLGALERAHAELAARDAVAVTEIEQQVVDVALAVAAAVLEREIAIADDPGADALRRALRLAPQRGAVVARLAPADVAGLGDVASLVAGREIEIVADPQVAPGGCIVDVGAARVDATIESALDRVRAVLSGDADGAVL